MLLDKESDNTDGQAKIDQVETTSAKVIDLPETQFPLNMDDAGGTNLEVELKNVFVWGSLTLFRRFEPSKLSSH